MKLGEQVAATLQTSLLGGEDDFILRPFYVHLADVDSLIAELGAKQIVKGPPGNLELFGREIRGLLVNRIGNGAAPETQRQHPAAIANCRMH